MGLRQWLNQEQATSSATVSSTPMSNSDLALLQPHLEHVPLKFRQHLQSSNRRVKKVYFPESGIASVVAACGYEQRQAEIAVLRRGGMTGRANRHGHERYPDDLCSHV